ncbi:hypothetical protein [Sulfuracidifex tepidarius]
MVDTYEKVKEDSSGGGRRYPPTDDYEIVEWVWLTPFGELKSDYVEVKLTDDSKKSFIYNNKKFPPGVYYLIRRNGRESLVSESVLKP